MGGFLRRSEPQLHSVILLDRPACAGLPVGLPSLWSSSNNKRATLQQEARRSMCEEARATQLYLQDEARQVAGEEFGTHLFTGNTSAKRSRNGSSVPKPVTSHW